MGECIGHLEQEQQIVSQQKALKVAVFILMATSTLIPENEQVLCGRG